jgi:hypothetical protein
MLRQKKGNECVSFLYDNQPYQLVETDILKILSLPNLQTIGFTARRTGRATSDQNDTVENKTLEFNNVNLLNPIYASHSIDSRLRPFDEPGNAMVKGHVIFCNNIDKGLILKLICDRFGHFERYILIDDNPKNLISFEKAVSELGNSEFIGYHYTAANYLDNATNADIIALQEQYLLQEISEILTDEKAKQLLK